MGLAMLLAVLAFLVMLVAPAMLAGSKAEARDENSLRRG